MVKEKDLYFIKDELIWINSLGKRVKREPKVNLGAWYIVEVVYEDIYYGDALFISSVNLESSHIDIVEEAKKILVDRIINKIERRGYDG